jgi:hypothetical protein
MAETIDENVDAAEFALCGSTKFVDASGRSQVSDHPDRPAAGGPNRLHRRYSPGLIYIGDYDIGAVRGKQAADRISYCARATGDDGDASI